MATIIQHTTRAPGTVLTAAIYNSDHQVHVTNAEALNTEIASLATLSPADGNFIVGNGTQFIIEAGATARASLGIGLAISAKTANYTALPADVGSILKFGTNNATLNLTAAVTLGSGWFCYVVADNVRVTIDPAGADSINGWPGGGTYVLNPGSSGMLVCVAAGFWFIGFRTPRVFFYDAGAAHAFTHGTRQYMVEGCGGGGGGGGADVGPGPAGGAGGGSGAFGKTSLITLPNTAGLVTAVFSLGSGGGGNVGLAGTNGSNTTFSDGTNGFQFGGGSGGIAITGIASFFTTKGANAAACTVTAGPGDITSTNNSGEPGMGGSGGRAGDGANSPRGTGGLGNPTNVTAAGNSGQGLGSGGGGARTTGAAARAGGAGTAGYIIVTEVN